MITNKRTRLTGKIGHYDNKSSASTPLYPIQHHPISRIPGLNPDSEYIAKNQMKEFRTYRNQERENTDFVKLCRQGGRKDLLCYNDKPEKNNYQQATQYEDIYKTSSRPENLPLRVGNRRTLKTPQEEIPFIDQLRMSGHVQKYRPDILPVDEKAKLYFAYNRVNDTYTRVITTSPKTFRFGGRRHY